MDSTSGDVGGDEGLSVSGREEGQGPVALVLGTTAVHGNGTDTHLGELAGETVGPVAGSGEHDGSSCLFYEIGGVLDAVVVIHQPEVMAGVHRVGFHRPRLMTNRVALVITAQHGDVAVEGGGEQQGLAGVAGEIEDAPHRGEEAHIGHSVGLVDHDDLDFPQVHGSLGNEVLETTWRSHQDIDPFAEAALLEAVTDATVYGDDGASGRPSQGSQLHLDLLGELPGGGEDQGTGPMAGGFAYPGEQREPEGEGLSRTGGCLPGDVLALEGVGDGGGLDGKWLGDALF